MEMYNTLARAGLGASGPPQGGGMLDSMLGGLLGGGGQFRGQEPVMSANYGKNRTYGFFYLSCLSLGWRSFSAMT